MGWTVPYLRTPPEIGRKMLKIARVGSGDVVYDLGCGDGYVLIMAVKEFGADRAVGIRDKGGPVQSHPGGDRAPNTSKQS